MPSSSAPPRTLRELLRVEPRLAPERALRLLADLAIALRPLHARGSAYGALTPEHVLLDPGGRATLAVPSQDGDAGAAQPWPTYLAPEQIDGRAPDPRSDVYALGLVGWEMLAGRQPWEGESLYGVVVKQREHDLPRLSTLRPGLPRGLVQAVEGALHKHPEDRWQRADELQRALDTALGGVSADAMPTMAVPALDAPRSMPPDRAAAVPPLPTPTPPRPAAAPPSPSTAPAVGAAAAVPPRATPHEPPRRVEPAARPMLPPRAAHSADDLDEIEEATVVSTGGVPRAPRRRRPMALAVLGLALVGASAAGLVAVQGRQESSETSAWLDSLSTASAGEIVIEDSVEARKAATSARRDSLARVARARAAARRDSIRRAAAAVPVAAGDTVAAAADTPVAEPAVAPAAEAPATPDVGTGGSGACASPTTADQRACLLALLEEEDTRLTRSYNGLIADLRRRDGDGEPASVQALRAEQRAWLAERDATCARQSRANEGELWAPVRARCLGALGVARAAELDARRRS